MANGSSGSSSSSCIPVMLAHSCLAERIPLPLKGAAYSHSEWSEVVMLVRCRAGHTPVCVQRLANHQKNQAQLSRSQKRREGREQGEADLTGTALGRPTCHRSEGLRKFYEIEDATSPPIDPTLPISSSANLSPRLNNPLLHHFSNSRAFGDFA